MKDYCLISYTLRRNGRAEWEYANMAWKGGMSDWFRYMKQFEDQEQHVLLNAIPISKSQYDWIKDNV